MQPQVMKYLKYLGLSLLLFSSFLGIAQTVINVSSTAANGTYKVGDVIPITVTFSENVIVTGIPQLTLETGTTDVVVDYSSGSGTSTLTFNYTVAAGNNSTDLDYVGISSLGGAAPNPSIPSYVELNGSATGIAINGNYAYVSGGGGDLAVIDISDPTNPGIPAYTENSGGNIQGLTISGDYAYLAANNTGLVIIDISDPENPGTPISSNTFPFATEVAVSGDYTYLVDDGMGDLSRLGIIDISDPINPGSPVFVQTNFQGSYGIAISGNYAYMTGPNNGLAIIDISDPTNPGAPVYIEIPGSNPQGLTISGDYAYWLPEEVG